MSLKILTVILAGLLTTQFLSAQAWYNSNWEYRVPVTVTNTNTGSALTNFQVQVILGSGFPWGSTLPGGADVIFTTTGAAPTLIDFWIESWDVTVPGSEKASIWVEVPSIPASDGITPGSATVYMYFSNPGAGSTSNGFTTFDFFDDFNTGPLDIGGRWTSSGGTWSLQSDTQQDGTTGNVAQGIAGGAYNILRSSYTGGDYVLEGWGKQVVGRVWGFGIRTTDVTHTYSLNLYEDIDAVENLYLYNWTAPNTAAIVWRGSQGAISMNTWYKLKIKAHGTNFDVYFNDLFRATATNSQWTTGAISLFLDNNQTARYNDVRVRKWAASEPSAVSGTPETNPYPPLNITLNSQTNVSCNGRSDGAVSITVTGGTQPYTYSWTGPNGFTSASEDLTGLSAGDYSLLVTAVNGSSGNFYMTISQPSMLSAGYAVTVPFDCVTGTATIVITASGGTPPYNYNGGEVSTFQQAVGTTTYTVTDANGCTANVTVIINADGSWLDPDWMYRKAIDVLNPGASVLTGFQVEVSLDGSFDFSKTNNDGSDVRFTSEDGVSMIPYWIDTWDEGNTIAKIWIKVPSIPAAGTTIYMYYGNTAATAVSDGDDTFEFFDDFSSQIASQPGYYTFGPASTIMVQEYLGWNESSSPHTLSVVKAPETGAFEGEPERPYTYYGYYGPQGSGYIGIAGSYDLLTWTRFPYNTPAQPGQDNPLFTGNAERWPSVYREDVEGVTTFYMVHTMHYGGPSYLVYRTSPDGLTWTEPTTIIQDAYNNQNPSLFHDPVSGHYFLYWYRGENGWSIMARE